MVRRIGRPWAGIGSGYDVTGFFLWIPKKLCVQYTANLTSMWTEMKINLLYFCEEAYGMFHLRKMQNECQKDSIVLNRQFVINGNDIKYLKPSCRFWRENFQHILCYWKVIFRKLDLSRKKVEIRFTEPGM